MSVPFALPERALHVLAIGCHSDDIEIGCGATLLTLLGSRPDLHVTWVVLSAEGGRAEVARASAADFLAGAAGHEVVVHDFRDGYFPYGGGDVKDAFEALKGRPDPDLIFTHSEHDRHQDHRLAAELTWNTFRRHQILEYEIPKYDGDIGNPGVFVPIADDVAARKVELLRAHFASQGRKHWFDDELFLGLLRLRGMQANSPTRYAEAFYCRKLTLAL
jgi:LmbE family N-acetylglucosaminyl deacetylase